jgi:hypothetical protein
LVSPLLFPAIGLASPSAARVVSVWQVYPTKKVDEGVKHELLARPGTRGVSPPTVKALLTKYIACWSFIHALENAVLA